METINKNEHGAYLMSTVTFLCRGKFNEMLRPDDDGANVLGADGFIVALLAHTNNILSLSQLRDSRTKGEEMVWKEGYISGRRS